MLIMAAVGAVIAAGAAVMIGLGGPSVMLLIALFGGPFIFVGCGAAAVARLIAEARWSKER